MAKLDYNKLVVGELTCDTLNLLKDGNMIVKSNAALRLMASESSIVLDDTNKIDITSPLVNINNINLTEFLTKSFVTKVVINGEDITNNDGQIDFEIPTNFLFLNDDNALIISKDDNITKIDHNGIDTTSVSAVDITANNITLQNTIDDVTTQLTLNSSTLMGDNLEITAKKIITDDIVILDDGNEKELALKEELPIIDSVLSDDSENPVQNKVIKQALDTKYNINDILDNITEDVDKLVSSQALYNEFALYLTINDYNRDKNQIDNNIFAINQDISAINRNIIDINNNINDNINNDISQLQASIQQLDNKKYDTSNIITDTNTDLNDNNNAVSGNVLYYQIGNVQAKHNELEQTINDLDSNLQSQIDTLDNDKYDTSSIITDTNAPLDNNNAVSGNVLYYQISNIQEKHNSDIEEVEGSIDTLTQSTAQSIDDINTSITGVDNKIDNVNDSLSNNISQLNDKITTINNIIDNLSGDTSEDVSNLQNQITNLQKYIDKYIHTQKQHLDIDNILLDGNEVLIYINQNFTFDTFIMETGIIYENCGNANIEEDNFTIENYEENIIKLTESVNDTSAAKRKRIVVKMDSSTMMNNYIHLRLYAKIKDEDTIYSTVYSTTKEELQNYTYYYPIIWNPINNN